MRAKPAFLTSFFKSRKSLEDIDISVAIAQLLHIKN